MTGKVTLADARIYFQSLQTQEPPISAIDQIALLEKLAKKISLDDDETFDFLDKAIIALMEICYPSKPEKDQ